MCISSVKYSYYWKYRHQKTICVETKCFKEKQKITGIQSTDSVKRTCKDTQSFTSENKCFSNNKSRAKSCIIYDSAQTSSNEWSLFSTVYSTTSTSIIANKLLSNSYADLLKLSFKSIGMMMFKTNVAGYLHRKLIKVANIIILTYGPTLNVKINITGYLHPKIIKVANIFMTSWPTLNAKSKSFGPRHHRKHISNSGFFFFEKK